MPPPLPLPAYDIAENVAPDASANSRWGKPLGPHASAHSLTSRSAKFQDDSRPSTVFGIDRPPWLVATTVFRPAGTAPVDVDDEGGEDDENEDAGSAGSGDSAKKSFGRIPNSIKVSATATHDGEAEVDHAVDGKDGDQRP